MRLSPLSSSSLLPPPTAKNQWTIHEFFDVLPSIAMTRQSIITTSTLSDFNADE
jgi:hypothetical protein